MDPLEDVLALLDTHSHLSAGLAAGGDWCVRFAPPSGVKFNSVRRGGCLLDVDGEPGPLVLAEGDCFLLTRQRGFTLRSGPGLEPVDAGHVFGRALNGIARVGEGEDVLLVGGRFTFGQRAQELLLDNLPPVVHVPAGTGQAETVRWALDAIDGELRQRGMGATLVARHLSVVMLVHVLRLHLAERPSAASGWLGGLGDPAVAAALAAVHGEPARPWTVAELARCAAVSRSTLALRFRRAVGQGPLEYLTRWRIELAAKRLREGGDPVAVVARAVGYGSDSALSTAFKRAMGMSPRDYRKAVGARPTRAGGGG